MPQPPPPLALSGAPPALAGSQFNWPENGPEIRAALEPLLADGSWGHYHGPALDQLQARLETHFGGQRVHLCSSGTIAVELALRGAGVSPGDEVVLAAYDFPGNFRAIEAIGARPVLIDVVAGGWVMDPKNLEQALSPRTRAVLVSHLHGQIADLPQLRAILDAIAPDQSIALVEDACQCPGGHFQDQPLGSLGDVAALSFGGSKLLSAGRGGAVLSGNEQILQRIRVFCERGNESFPLSQLQAAVLLPQLERLAELTRQRAQAAFELIDRLEPLHGWSSLPAHQRTADACPAFYKVPLLLDPGTWTASRQATLEALAAEGLPVGAGFRGFARRSSRRCRQVGSLNESRRAAASTVLLHHPLLLADAAVREQAAQAMERVWQGLPPWLSGQQTAAPAAAERSDA